MSGETLRRIDDPSRGLSAAHMGTTQSAAARFFRLRPRQGFDEGNARQFVSYDWQAKLRSLAGDRNGRCLAFDLQLRPERRPRHQQSDA